MIEPNAINKILNIKLPNGMFSFDGSSDKFKWDELAGTTSDGE